MLQDLKTRVLDANVRLAREGLAVQTFGNASGADHALGVMVIKPSGVGYDDLTPDDMVVLSLETGKVVDGSLSPSSDTPTHLVLYRAFQPVGGIVHTHSLHASAWAQACREIPVLGTTHADVFNGPVPCTRGMRPFEIEAEYEANTGAVIVERLGGLDPLEFPGVLVAHHGPFAWGESVEEAVAHAVALEFIARLASETVRLAPQCPPIPGPLLARHFRRKHGPGAYYGQKPSGR